MLSLLCVSPLVVGATQFPTETPTQEPTSSVPEGYHLVFEDEFAHEELDLTKWQHRYVNRSYLAGFNTETAVDQPGDGLLHLITRYDDDKFLTGMIQSVDRFLYGYFEASIQFQTLQGHHGAFWLQSPLYGKYTDNPADSGAEIDIIEFFGSGRSETDAQHNIHWNAYASEEKQQRSFDIYYQNAHGVELSEDFHRFALLWTPEEYVFFIDDVETWRTSEGLSHTPEYIVLSLITSSWENARLDRTRLPDEMVVDYVRVYAP